MMMMAIAVAAMMLGAVASNGSNGRDAEEMLTLLQRHEIQVLDEVRFSGTDGPEFPVPPGPLLGGLGDPTKRGPEPDGPIADRDFGRAHAASLEIA